MHAFFCPEQQQQQQQTLTTRKTLTSLDPFASVTNSYQSCENLPGLLRAANNQNIDLEKVWEQCYMWYPAANLQLHTVSVASFPCTPHPAFCPLPPYSKQQKARWGPEKEATQSTFWLLSPRKSCIPTWSTRVSQQLQLIKSYKFSCKSGLYSCLPTLPIAQNRNIVHNIYKKVAYK